MTLNLIARRTALALACSASFAGLSTAAQAAPVTSWGWGFNGGFTSWTDTGPASVEGTDQTFIIANDEVQLADTPSYPGFVPANPDGTIPTNTSGYQSLQWGGGTTSGTGDNCRGGLCRGGDPARSELSIVNRNSPPELLLGSDDGVGNYDFGDYVAIADINYSDNALAMGSVYLDAASMLGNLSLISNSDTIGALVQSFRIDFFDTDDSGVMDMSTMTTRCSAGEGVSAAGCSDIFLVSNTELDITLEQDGYRYIFDIILSDGSRDNEGNLISLIDTLSDEACMAVGAGVGCSGFLTAEGANLEAFMNIRVRAELIDPTAVPEPAALGVLGLGLLGLGALRRRRTA